MIHKDTYEAFMKQGLDSPNQYDFQISLYEIRGNNIPRDDATYKIFAPYPKLYPKCEASRKWIMTQMSNKLTAMGKLFDLEPSKIVMVNPYSNRATGAYHRHMNVNILAPGKTVALIKVLLDMTQWYVLPWEGFDSENNPFKDMSKKEINDCWRNTSKYHCRLAWNTNPNISKKPYEKKPYEKKPYEKKPYVPNGKKPYVPNGKKPYERTEKNFAHSQEMDTEEKQVIHGVISPKPVKTASSPKEKKVITPKFYLERPLTEEEKILPVTPTRRPVAPFSMKPNK
jgi:hypothetical protein